MTDIYAALSAVMGDVQSIGKDSTNKAQKYKFRGIDAVMDAVGPELRKHKVIVVPNVRSYEYGEILTGADRKPMGHARVVVEYTFYAPDGSHIVSSAAGEAFDSGDKATPKAMSVACRTALLQALCVPTGDPEPDADSYERSTPQEADPLAEAKAEAFAAARTLRLTNEEMIAEWQVWDDGGHPGTVTDPAKFLAFAAHLKSSMPAAGTPGGWPRNEDKREEFAQQTKERADS